jgi:hypothetical protein
MHCPSGIEPLWHQTGRPDSAGRVRVAGGQRHPTPASSPNPLPAQRVREVSRARRAGYRDCRCQGRAIAAQRRSACRTRRVATCGSFGRMDTVWSPSGPQRNTRNRRADHLRTGGRSGSRCVESDNGCRHRRGMRDWLAVFAEPGKVQLDGLPHLGQDCVAGHGVLRSSPACLRTLRSVPGGNSALSLPLLSPAGFQWVRELAVGSHGSDQV